MQGRRAKFTWHSGRLQHKLADRDKQKDAGNTRLIKNQKRVPQHKRAGRTKPTWMLCKCTCWVKFNMFQHSNTDSSPGLPSLLKKQQTKNSTKLLLQIDPRALFFRQQIPLFHNNYRFLPGPLSFLPQWNILNFHSKWFHDVSRLEMGGEKGLLEQRSASME